MISVAEWSGVVELLRETGRSEVMPRFRHLGRGDVRTKSSPTDLVTEADVAAELAIAAGLRALFPGCVVVGEEATAADPSLLRRMADRQLVFAVDPVDGTSNFVAGLPLFGMMVAAVSAGRTVAAAIHDPICDDTALALAGQGAWIERLDGGRTALRVADAMPPHEMTGCVSWRYLAPALQAIVVRNLPRLAASMDYRCAAHQYRMLASGHCHYLLFNKLMPWDHLPGVLLHQEAGGYAAHFDGSPYLPTDIEGGLICTPDEASFTSLRATLMDATAPA